MFRTALVPFTRKLFAMSDTRTNQQIAIDFATMRARDVEQVKRLPAASPGQWYVKGRDFYGDDTWTLESALLVCGSVAVLDYGAFVVVDVSGVRVTQFYERAGAERFARAIGDHVEQTFARAAAGNICAARSLVRLVRVHKLVARRRGSTGKAWTKRERKELEDAFRLASYYGVRINEDTDPAIAREPVIRESLSRSLSCKDEKLRRWRLRLLARVEREGLPT